MGRTMPEAIEAFFRCPRGHKLPHRRGRKGRCSPFDCCEAAGMAWAVVRQAEREQLRETSAYAEETQRMKERKDIMRVWNEAHPLPELPPPPKRGGSIQQYMKERMDQVAAYALELKIRKMVLDPGDGGLRQADDILDRQGTVKNPQGSNIGKGPVLIVNLQPEQNPYESQKRSELPARAATAVVEAEYTNFDPAQAGREEQDRESKPESRGDVETRKRDDDGASEAGNAEDS